MSLTVASLYAVTRPLDKKHNLSETCSILDEIFRKDKGNADIGVGYEYLLGGMPAGNRSIDKMTKNLSGLLKNSYNHDKWYYPQLKNYFKKIVDKQTTLNEQNINSVLKPIFDTMSTFGGSGDTKYFFFSNPFKEENNEIYNTLLYITSKGDWDILYKKEDIVESEKHFISSATPEENNNIPFLKIKNTKIAGCICKDRENGIIERNIKNYADVTVDPNLSDPFTANSFYFMNRYFINQPLANFSYYVSGSAISEGMLDAFKNFRYSMHNEDNFVNFKLGIPDNSNKKDLLERINSNYKGLVSITDVSKADATRAIFSEILNKESSNYDIMKFKEKAIGTGPAILGPDTIDVLKTANIAKNPNDPSSKFICKKIDTDKLNQNRKRLKTVFDSIEEFRTPSSKKIRYTDHYDIAENMSHRDILSEKLADTQKIQK